MKAAPFALARPMSVDETVTCLVEHGSDARLLAGGQSLMPMLAARCTRASVLVDLDRVGGLDQITRRPDGSVAIGAMVRQRAAERSAVVAEHVPALAMALPFIAHATVRNQGTVGGSVAHADPCGEIPNIVMLTGALVVVAGPRGERTIAAPELFVGPMSTSIAADEVLVEVCFPAMPSRCGSAFVEVSRRSGDPALVAVGAMVELDDEGLIVHAAITLSAVGPTPTRADGAAAMLVGERSSAELFAAVAATAAAGIDPATDLHATGAYRRHLTAVLVRRALAEAVGRVS